MGQLLSPEAWRTPWGVYACDNDVFAHSFLGKKPDAGWWEREGETRWLKMLDKVAAAAQEGCAPLFVLLPDVVADWHETLRRAWYYLPEIRARGLPVAVALQDGPVEEVIAAATMLSADYWFVGGTTKWKWSNAERLTQAAHDTFGTKLHVGRVGGVRRVEWCLRIGADSCDGSKWLAFADSVMPGLLNTLSFQTTQLNLEMGVRA